MSGPMLAVDDLRKEYPRARRSKGAEPIIAVDGVSLALRAGGSLAVVGESGSGKTTLGRMVVGLERPTSGSIAFGGHARGYPLRRATRIATARQIQMVFQDPYGSLDPRQSGRQCLDETLRVHSELSRSQRGDRINELADQVGLRPETIALPPVRLSGGQRQRLAIARALAVRPKVLVLDEAVSALDVSIQAQILNLLAQIRRDTDIAFLFISHDLAVVRQISDEVMVMRHGRVVETGPTSDVLDHPEHAYTNLLRDSVPRPGWVPARRSVSVGER
jgi:peptide/nickel transport system ATP-binding protein